MIEPAARSLHEQAEKLGESLRGPITHFANGVERLPAALASFREGADAIGRVGNDLEAIGSASESLSRSSTSLSRIELVLSTMAVDRSAPRRDPARDRPDGHGDRIAGRLVVGRV